VFRSTPPRGGRQFSGCLLIDDPLVSIHAPAWGATRFHSLHAAAHGRFDPRPRVGGDPRWSRRSWRLRPVSIHAPAWGATQCWPGIERLWPVSIHAPAWGATGRFRWSRGRHQVSIHAPAWGATFHCSTVSPDLEFRSTPPRGGRRETSLGTYDAFIVSIHAPAWGATRRHQAMVAVPPTFRSTPPRGGRRFCADPRARWRAFRSTPPRGGRPGAGHIPRACPRSFDPRPRVGGDLPTHFRPRGCRRFRSTPPRGGRPPL